MNKRIHLYGLLLAATLIQAVCMKHFRWFPDIMLLMVVFTGIFGGYAEGIKFGFVAGFLRGILSVYTLPVDLFLFPLIGAVSAVLAERFYRQNPVAEMFITAVAVFTAIVFHTSCLKIVSGNEFVGVWSAIAGSLRAVTVTIVFSPVFFHLLRGLRPQEE
ncbi:MAG: rod shape-determining protein MreD [Candidatus Omnitrophota bacterium]